MKKNFNRSVNKAHVSQLEGIISGAVTPTEEIMLSENGSVVLYENVFVPDKLIKLTDFYGFAVNWISLSNVLGITRMYLCISPGLACGMDLFHTHT